MAKRMSLDARIQLSRGAHADNECWPWHGHRDRRGYGIAARRPTGGSRFAHRVVFEHIVGPIPDGLVLDHLCRTPCCVNPRHLQPVTALENVQRGRHKNAFKRLCKKGHYAWVQCRSPKGRSYRVCTTCRDESNATNYEKTKEAQCAAKRSQYSTDAAFREAKQEYMRKYAIEKRNDPGFRATRKRALLAYRERQKRVRAGAAHANV